jgi:aspartyl-tRNA(Asn)/glutamyl-tRNA(Gln) amidotransferase subunit A
VNPPGDLGATAAALRRGEVSSAELVEAALTGADQVDGNLGLFLARFDESCRTVAGERDDELAAGHDRGPLHGVPVVIKDIIATSEGPTTAQSLTLEPGWGDGVDAPVVARLRAAGAVIVGKTTTMEFAVGYPDRDKPFPVPRNPWDPDRWPGGSSSGTAAAVAAGVVTAGVGTDTGGSVRLPASYCGITGFKATYGAVPKSGVVPLGYSLDHVGPMARTAQDCAALLEVMAGPHPADPTTVDVDPASLVAGLHDGIDGLRVGVARQDTTATEWCDPGVTAAFDQAVTVLEAAGARTREVRIAHFEQLGDADFLLLQAEAMAWHQPRLARRWDDYGRPTRLVLALGALVSGADVVRINRLRQHARRQMLQLLGDVDVVVLPTTGTAAPVLFHPIDRSRRLRSLFTPQFNLLGFPALSVPMGFDAGLPVGLQIVGRPLDDAGVLRVGVSYQARTSWHDRRPPVHVEAPTR